MSRTTALALPFTIVMSVLSFAACNLPENERTENRDDPSQVGSAACTVTETDENSIIIRCPDGSEATINHGKDGVDGTNTEPGDDEACTLIESNGNVHTLKCGSDEIILGDNCKDGFPGDLIISGEQFNGLNSVMATMNLLGCTQIQGNLEIQYSDSEALTDPLLSKITHVGGSVTITSNHFSEFSLAGLKSVGGDITINQNYELTTAGFPVLEVVDGSLNVGIYDPAQGYGGNEKLTDALFPQLTKIGQNFVISGNGSLQNLDGFTSLLSIGQDLLIRQNHELLNIEGIKSLENITGNVAILQNELLGSCDAKMQIQKLPGFAVEDRDAEKLVIDPDLCPK